MNPTSARLDESPVKIRFSTDASGNQVIYEGYPDGNAPTSEAKWAIKRTVVLADGTGVDSEMWAFGNRNKTQVFDNRESLTYKPIY